MKVLAPVTSEEEEEQPEQKSLSLSTDEIIAATTALGIAESQSLSGLSISSVSSPEVKPRRTVSSRIVIPTTVEQCLDKRMTVTVSDFMKPLLTTTPTPVSSIYQGSSAEKSTVSVSRSESKTVFSTTTPRVSVTATTVTATTTVSTAVTAVATTPVSTVVTTPAATTSRRPSTPTGPGLSLHDLVHIDLQGGKVKALPNWLDEPARDHEVAGLVNVAKSLQLAEPQVCRFLNIAKALEANYAGGIRGALAELKVLPRPGLLQVTARSSSTNKEDVIIVAPGGQIDLHLLMSRLAELSSKPKPKDTPK